MAAIIPPTTNTIPSSSLSFSFLSPLPLTRFFHFPAPPPFIPKTSLFLSKIKPQNPLLVSPSQPSFSYPQTPVSNSQPLSTSHSVNSFLDSFFHLLRLSSRYDDSELARAVHARILKYDEDIYLRNALISAYLKLGLVSDAYNVFLGLSCPNLVSYTSMISGFAKSNREDEAVELFLRMWVSGIDPNEYSFVAILTACIRNIDFYELGLQVHATVIKMGYLDCVFISNALMGFYSKCGCLDLVLRLFDEMSDKDIASWNTVISSLAKEFMFEKTFNYFRYMQQNDGFKVDHLTLSTLLTACTGSISSKEGREIHAHAIKVGLETHLSVSNALIGFYTKCGSLKDVMKLFEKMPERDVVTWTELITSYMEFGSSNLATEIFNTMPERNCISYNALLAGFSKNNSGWKAIRFFVEMLEKGVELSEFTITSVATACGSLGDCAISEQIHGFILKFGIVSNDCIETALLDMYTRCGRIEDAKKMYNRQTIDIVNSAMLTSMICGYARNGLLNEAISLFHISQSGGTMFIDDVASTTVLKLCGSLGFHDMGKQMHCHATKSGLLSDLGVANATLSMYAKCFNMSGSIRVFNTMNKHDIVSWNGLISGHLLHRQGDRALAIWRRMEEKGIKPDNITFVLIISAYRYTYMNLADNCRSLFYSMRSVYEIDPGSDHYAAFVSVLGRWDLLEEAEETIKKIPSEPDICVWRALLDSCRIHSNAIIGKRVVKRILDLEPRDPSSYILVSNLYSASGRWYCSEMVRKDMRERGLRKNPGQSWIFHENKIHSFYARDKSHSQAKDICRALEILILECLKAGYVPDTSFVLHEVEEHQKNDFLFYHSAKLAATYGILMTKPGKPIRIMKNIILCGDCHNFLKYVSVVTGREIIVRDTSGFHCFCNGGCSCKGHY